MKRTFSLLLLSLAVMLGLSMAAFADDTITFTGVSGTNYGGWETGVYYGTLNGDSKWFICDDANDEISYGQSWSATEYPLSNVGTPGNGLFSGGGSPYTATYATGEITPQKVYNAVAWLAVQIYADPTGPDVNAIQYAIWNLMDDPCENLNNCGPSDTTGWINQALTHTDYQNPNIFFATPVAPSKGGKYPQEFIYDPLFPTPEPMSMVLMGTFLSLAGVLLSRKKRAS